MILNDNTLTEIEKMFLIQAHIGMEKLHELKPWVIDPQSTFIDRWGNTHSDACGWLAIHAAIHYDIYRKYSAVPSNIKAMWDRGELCPSALKLKSGCNYTAERIQQSEITKLCKELDIGISEHFINTTPGDVKHMATNYPIGEARNGKYYVDIWLTEGTWHYYAYIGGESSLEASQFALENKHYGYNYYQLDPLKELESDAELAKRLSKQQW